MDRWIYGQVGGQVDRWTGEWGVYRWVDRLVGGLVGWMDRWVGEQVDMIIDGCMNRWMDGLVCGWVDCVWVGGWIVGGWVDGLPPSPRSRLDVTCA